jgi:nucleotide-binding universal stress UspA family protein
VIDHSARTARPIGTLKLLIVGFDGSDTGHDGLALATGLAKMSGARVVVTYVYDATLADSSATAAAELLENAEATLATARPHISQMLDVAFQPVAATSPAAGIQELASRQDADLIVLGSRGLGPATRIALGSVSHQVVTDARCAVAVAPRGYREHGGYVPQAIGVSATAGQAGEAEAVAIAHALADATAGTVHELPPDHIGHSDESDHLKDAEHVAEALIRHSGRLDLIIIPSGIDASGAPGLEPIALTIIERARCPVMIVPAARPRHSEGHRRGGAAPG